MRIKWSPEVQSVCKLLILDLVVQIVSAMLHVINICFYDQVEWRATFYSYAYASLNDQYSF
jgi:hypothetical protein